jgi:hypothetical protein
MSLLSVSPDISGLKYLGSFGDYSTFEEFNLICSYCQKPGKVVCSDCNKFFCEKCFVREHILTNHVNCQFFANKLERNDTCESKNQPHFYLYCSSCNEV